MNPVAQPPVTGHDAADVLKQSDARTSKPNLSDADAATDTNIDQRSSRNSLWFSSVKAPRPARKPAARVIRKEDRILSPRSDKATSNEIISSKASHPQHPVPDSAKGIGM